MYQNERKEFKFGKFLPANEATNDVVIRGTLVSFSASPTGATATIVINTLEGDIKIYYRSPKDFVERGYPNYDTRTWDICYGECIEISYFDRSAYGSRNKLQGIRRVDD